MKTKLKQLALGLFFVYFSLFFFFPKIIRNVLFHVVAIILAIVILWLMYSKNSTTKKN